MSKTLLITERKDAAIDAPTYTFEVEGSVTILRSYEVESFVLHAEAGVGYRIESSGNSDLKITINGPGLTTPLETSIGSLASFTAPVRGTYTITVASPVVNTSKLAGDRPYYGAFSLDVYSSVADDVGLVLPVTQFTPQTVGNFQDSIDPSTYKVNAAGTPVELTAWDTDTFTFQADAGDYYGLLTKGASGLKVTITGPGMVVVLDDGTVMEVPVDGKIGDALGFQAVVAGTYTISVESETAATSVSSQDRPHSGSYSIELKKTEREDIDGALGGAVLTTNNQIKGRINTASDADQIFGAIPAGASAFFAAHSSAVTDITIEVFEAGAEGPLAASQASSGFSVLSFTSPATATYEMLVRSGSYYQVGDYEIFGGQRLAPSNVLTVGKPDGDTLVFSDNTNREVWGWRGNTTITTGGGKDVLVATLNGNDILRSGAGDDEIYLAGGVDFADGGAGRDVAYFLGVKDFVSFSKSGGNLILSGAVFAGSMTPVMTTATLSNVEYVKFLDGLYEVGKERFLVGIVHLDRPGNDEFKGGKSIESVVFNGNRSDFSVTIAGKAATVVDKVGGSGVNSTSSVEKLLFDDMSVQIDFVGVDGKSGKFNELGTAGRAASAILAVWGKNGLADKQLAGVVIDYFGDGAEAEDAALILYGAGLLAEAAGGDSNDVVLDHLYTNLVGTAPSKAQHDQLMTLFDNPEFTQIELLLFALNHPVTQQQLKLMGVWDHGLEYIAPPPIDVGP